MAHKIEVLTGHCEAEGRDPAEIEKTIIAMADPLADVSEFLKAMESYSALGIEQVWVSPPGPDPVGWVTELTENVLPELREL